MENPLANLHGKLGPELKAFKPFPFERMLLDRSLGVQESSSGVAIRQAHRLFESLLQLFRRGED
jgi:hypothetical protein